MKTASRIAFGILLLVYAVALVPDFFSPYPPSQQFREYPYVLPGMCGGAPPALFVHGDPYNAFALLPPSVLLFGSRGAGLFFLLGPDLFGRDVYSRLCHNRNNPQLNSSHM